MHALIADDDRTETLILSKTLERWGLTPVVAHDGAQAWDLLQAGRTSCERPALAVLDWMMPGIDGVELCGQIREDESLRHMYILLLTARDSRKDLVAGLDAGADDYLVKPFDPDELRARVQVGLRVLSLQERLAERVLELQTALSQVNQLHGLLPICSYCKRIRTDENYWQQVESYISEHTQARFSHGICPPCYETALKQLASDASTYSHQHHA